MLNDFLNSIPVLWAVAIGTVIDHSGLPLFLLAGAAASPLLTSSLVSIVLAGAAGSLVGDLLLFAVGRFVGREALVAGCIARRFRHPFEYAITRIESHPQTGLVLFRFIPAVGKYAPLIAGAVGRPAFATISLCALGSAIYAAFFGLIGWLLQPTVVAELRSHRGVFGPILGILAVGVFVFAAIRDRKKSVEKE